MWQWNVIYLAYIHIIHQFALSRRKKHIFWKDLFPFIRKSDDMQILTEKISSWSKIESQFFLQSLDIFFCARDAKFSQKGSLNFRQRWALIQRWATSFLLRWRGVGGYLDSNPFGGIEFGPHHHYNWWYSNTSYYK